MEQTLSSFVVTIMKYQDQWVEMGSTPGQSNLIFLKSPTGEYRYVAMKETNNEVVINEYLSAETQYVESTESFHCIYLKNGTLCGINFVSVADAKKSSSTVYSCIEHLKGKMTPSIPEADAPPAPSVAKPSFNNSPLATKPPVRKISKPQIGSSNNATPNNNVQKERSPEVAATGAPPGVVAPPIPASAGAPPPPPAGGPPPPPPAGPPAPPGIKKAATSAPKSGGNDMASQLQAAVSKPRKPITEPTSSPAIQTNNNSTSAAPRPSIGGGGGGGDLMSEIMAKRLKKTNNNLPGVKKPEPASPVMKKTDSPVINSGPRRSSIRGPDTQPIVSASTGRAVTHDDLDKMRKQIMSDVTTQLNQLKTEIIEGICSRLQN